jgi:hypothetical protein
VAHFTPLNIDFPLELTEFENIWFNQTYVSADAFTYKIFQNNAWSEPWSQQDIYDDVLEIMLAHEVANPPDFAKIYGEPEIFSEEKSEKLEKETEKFTEKPIKNKDIEEIETKMRNIMEEAKHNGLEKELTCNCNDCKK